jgi:tetratricopeptide (TPR) repeat protein
VLLVIAAIIAWQALRPGEEQPPIEPAVELNYNRIAVVPFVNRTADVALDGLAARTADRLTQGLSELAELDVAPASAVAAAAGGAGTGALVRDVAKATNSGLVLTGVWDAVVDGLELQATLQDAQTETIVHAFEPIRASRDAPDEAIATLRDWTLMAVQDHLYPALAFAAGDQFPKYEAYQEYRAWLGTLGSDRWQKVVELDPDWLRARITISLALAIGRRFAQAEIFLEPLEGDDRLTVRQAHIVSGIRHHLEHRWQDALDEFTWVAEHSGDNYFIRLGLMVYAVNANRPRLALEHFERLRPPPFGSPLAAAFAYTVATYACHMLGLYEQELQLAEQLQAINPGWGAWFAARALVALGRLDELEDLVSAAQAARQGPGGAAGVLMHRISVFLKSHGYHEESVTMAERAADWWRTSNLEEQGSERCEYCVADSLHLAGRLEEAMVIYRELERQDPTDIRALKSIALAAAELGDRVTAEGMLTRLDAAHDGDWDSIDELYIEGSVAELLGDCDEALSLFREAIALGCSDWIGLHGGSGCVSDNPEFQKLIAPKG